MPVLLKHLEYLGLAYSKGYIKKEQLKILDFILMYFLQINAIPFNELIPQHYI